MLSAFSIAEWNVTEYVYQGGFQKKFIFCRLEVIP